MSFSLSSIDFLVDSHTSCLFALSSQKKEGKTEPETGENAQQSFHRHGFSQRFERRGAMSLASGFLQVRTRRMPSTPPSSTSKSSAPSSASSVMIDHLFGYHGLNSNNQRRFVTFPKRFLIPRLLSFHARGGYSTTPIGSYFSPCGFLPCKEMTSESYTLKTTPAFHEVSFFTIIQKIV